MHRDRQFIPSSFLLMMILLMGNCQEPGNYQYEADLAIQHATILTMDEAGTIIADGTLLVKNGEILALGVDSTLQGLYRAKQVMDAKGKILLPGLINTHTHLAMTLFRGISDDLPLKDWLEKHIWPIEHEILNEHSVRIGSMLGMAELIKSGTTSFLDMYFFSEQIAQVADEVGMRAWVGEGLLDFPAPTYANPKEGLAYTRQLIDKWAEHPLVSVTVSPHSPYTASTELLKSTAALAKEKGTLWNIHLAETAFEKQVIATQHKASPTAYLASLGILGDNVVGAHGVYLDSTDIQLMVEAGGAIAHCPESNMKLASGIAWIPQMLAAGLDVGLGTDGAASNNDLDLFEEMSTAAKLHKVNSMDPTVLPAQQVLEMATMGGARLLNEGDHLGSLEEGKAADFILVDPGALHMQPLYNLYSQLVYSCDGNDVTHVWVNGKMLLADRKLLTIDEMQLKKDLVRLSEEVQAVENAQKTD